MGTDIQYVAGWKLLCLGLLTFKGKILAMCFHVDTIQGKEIILLLVGGDKSNQAKDIKKANNLLKELEK